MDGAFEGRGAKEGELRALRGEHAAEKRAAEREAGLAAERQDGLEAELAEARASLREREGELAEIREQLAALGGEDQPDAALGERMALAFERAPVGTALAAPDGRITQVNRVLCDLLGYDAKRLLSGDAPALVHPDDVDARRELARRILLGDQSVARGYRRYLHADGHTITMRESIALVRDGQGDPVMFVFQLEEAHGREHGGEVVIDVEVATDGGDCGELVPVRGEGDPLSAEMLRRAIEEESFELHCQPVVDLRTNEVTQYELLTRLVADGGRLILPQAFLPPARAAGLAQAIDRWVVRKALGMLAGDPASGHALEVNLSPEAIDDPDLLEIIEEELAASAIDPARLILELTGQAAVESLQQTHEFAMRLRGLGCRFALDDFRSTFGSFRILKDLPLDYLKLDGELVGSLAESRTSQLIVKALVEVAEGTATRTVAVFVTDEPTLGVLRRQGVDFAQGYAVGRPRPVAELWGSAQAALPPGAATG
ncbi:MAG: hypothetical protein NVS2B6_14630 [Thermoleophilaceae bacterium]